MGRAAAFPHEICVHDSGGSEHAGVSLRGLSPGRRLGHGRPATGCSSGRRSVLVVLAGRHFLRSLDRIHHLRHRIYVQKKLDSAQAIVASLIDHGVDWIFGIPGAHTYKLFDALYERRDRIRFIGTRHEQGAAYMAYGYAKSTGRVGVYTCVPGPGVLNTTAALCTAYAANAPVLCLTSEIPAAEIGRAHGILHELPDQLGTLRSLTKWSERIDQPTAGRGHRGRRLLPTPRGRPGPVALECPWDTLGARLVDLTVPRAGRPPPADPSRAQRRSSLRRRKQPMIMVGGGAFGAATRGPRAGALAAGPVTAHRSGRGIRGRETTAWP